MDDRIPKPRDAVRAMAPYSPPSGGRRGKLRLDFNENTLGCSPRVVAALHEYLNAGELSIYPEYGAVKEAIARYFKVEPGQLIFTNGTDEAIQIFINTYVDAGREIVLLKPSYAMYRFYGELAGAKIVEVEYGQPGMEFPLEALLKQITSETRAVILANPNNPTGTGMSLRTVERVLECAGNAVVLVDEAYFEFCGVTAIENIGRIPNLFVSRTFSKVFGMAAMRLGCLFSGEGNVQYLRKAQSPYSVNSLAPIAARAAIEDLAYTEAYVAEVLAGRALLCVWLDRFGIPYFPSSANFVLVHFGARAVEIRDSLGEQGILVRDRSYEVAGCVRITVGACEHVRRLLTALEEIWRQ